jgi:hypothetical protein
VASRIINFIVLIADELRRQECKIFAQRALNSPFEVVGDNQIIFGISPFEPAQVSIIKSTSKEKDAQIYHHKCWVDYVIST